MAGLVGRPPLEVQSPKGGQGGRAREELEAALSVPDAPDAEQLDQQVEPHLHGGEGVRCRTRLVLRRGRGARVARPPTISAVRNAVRSALDSSACARARC